MSVMAEAYLPPIKMDVNGTRFDLVRSIAQELNIRTAEVSKEDCDLYWYDTGVSADTYLKLKPHQMINQFPGMAEISRKDCLARNFKKMKAMYPTEFNMLPPTWVLPYEYNALSTHWKETRNKQKTFIIKPHNLSMGNGISLARSISDVPQRANVVVQEYISNPLLLDGYKFDLRVYVLVTSCNPFRVFIYKDGLVRLCTREYQPPNDSNINCTYMHLTNYSINKHSLDFNHSEDVDKGSKRSLKYFNGWLMNNQMNSAEIWSKINDLVVKTLILAQPNLQHSYQTYRPANGPNDKCQSFAILGFDIMIDENLKPWLLEVNKSPSFGTEASIDLIIKTGVIKDALQLVDVSRSSTITTVTHPAKVQRLSSHTKMVAGSFKPPRFTQQRSYFDYSKEMKDALLLRERKILEIKNRLSHIRREKELEQFEDQNMGEYVRVYPSADPVKQMLYEQLMKDSAKICFQMTPKSAKPTLVKGLHKMKERELMDLLEQFEIDYMESHVESKPVKSIPFGEPSHLVFPDDPLDQARNERMFEEAQNQCTMVSLNEIETLYLGKKPEDVKKLIDETEADWTNYKEKVKQFWLKTLDNNKRKELLVPVRDAVRQVLKFHWRASVLDFVKLSKIFTTLFNFFLENHGRGLWCTFPGASSTDDHWETLFKEKNDVMTVTEMCCCRRVAILTRGTVMAAYRYCERENLVSIKKILPPPSLLSRRKIMSQTSLSKPGTQTNSLRQKMLPSRPKIVPSRPKIVPSHLEAVAQRPLTVPYPKGNPPRVTSVNHRLRLVRLTKSTSSRQVQATKSFPSNDDKSHV